MTERDFIYWLQGMLEYTNVSTLTGEDCKSKLAGIQEHLKLVMTKVTLDTLMGRRDYGVRPTTVKPILPDVYC